MQRLHATVQDASITAPDGATLKAWFLIPPNPSGQSVIILHGVTANRVDSTGFAEMFLRKGYKVLVPDSREHGESGGVIATYGILERYDVRQWVQWMRQRAPGCTFLLGESMGAAIGLQAAAATPDLCAVAVEDPYAGFRELAYERLGRGSHTGTLFWQTLGRPILEAAILYTRLRYGIYLPNADDKAAVEHASTPTLLIAGTKDLNIPMHHAQELQQACPAHCTLWDRPPARITAERRQSRMPSSSDASSASFVRTLPRSSLARRNQFPYPETYKCPCDSISASCWSPWRSRPA